MFFFLDEKERKNQESPNVASRQSLAATRTFILLIVVSMACSPKSSLLEYSDLNISRLVIRFLFEQDRFLSPTIFSDPKL